MNDFDFEELDSAVSQLATKTHDEHDGPGPVTLRPLVASSASELASVPVVAPVPDSGQAVQSTPTTLPVASSPVQKHRLGDTSPRPKRAFMDIVPPARKPVQRVGISIQPIDKAETVMTEEPKRAVGIGQEPKPVAPELVEQMPPEHTGRPVADSPAQKTASDVSWPDPLDFQREDPMSEESIEQKTPDTQSEEDQPEPSSPFLSEAKVEKRPLGAFSNFRPTAELKPAKPVMPEDAKAGSDELTPENDGIFKEPEESKELLEKQEPEQKAESESSTKQDMHSAAMMSITQQYRTEAKDEDKAPRSVFDTKEYHPPLLEAAVHDHRGEGMWGKLFIALVVLAILGAGGYFTYLYFMPR
jgi:hypothetical protein